MSRSTFDDLPPGTLATPSPPISPHRRRHWARRLERNCCRTLAYFPLLFVYGLTTWAVWVEVHVAFFGTSWDGIGSEAPPGAWSFFKAVLGVVLWALANVSYTIAVFTPPGSPMDERRDVPRAGGRKGEGYAGLPTYEDEDHEGGTEAPHGMTTVTAKSTGKPRYCKKCHTTKPDRTHHCSTCGQCVLKMDHHCPWLATCVGLRNYKPFILFLIYTSTFCWLCFGITASWVWAEIVDDVQMREGLMVVNVILLAVLGGIIGLVLSGFTGWHIYLVMTGQTTIESLEKTRYLSPLRRSMESQPHRRYLDQPHPGLGDGNGDEEQTLTEHLKEIHANALPGVLRPEEGEISGTNTPIPPSHAYTSSSGSPAKDSLQHSYASMEEQRERDRYAAYLDELDSEKLPNAFDLGWRRNLVHVFGEKPWFWALPVCNTSGDGWMWEVSPKWREASAEAARARAARDREETMHNGGLGGQPPPAFEPPRRDFRWTPGQGFVNQARNAVPPRTSSAQGQRHHESDLQMQPLDRRKGAPHQTSQQQQRSSDDDGVDSYDTSSGSDEEVRRMYSHPQVAGIGGGGGVGDWNDVPDEYLSPRRNGLAHRSRSRGRRKGD